MGFQWDFHGISMGFIGDLDHLVNSMGSIKTPPMHPEEPKKPYGKMMGIFRIPLNFMDSLEKAD